MPVDAILEQVDASENEPVYDIVVPYGPYRSQGENRGGYSAVLAAQSIINTYPMFNDYVLLNWVLPNHEYYDEIWEKSNAVLEHIGCKDFTLLPGQDWRKVLRMYKNAKLVINLDWTPSIGRVAAECALLKVPYIGTDFPNLGHYIYGDILTVSPYDIDKIVALAKMVNDGTWPESWINNAYNKAVKLSLPNKARELEGFVESVQ